MTAFVADCTLVKSQGLKVGGLKNSSVVRPGMWQGCKGAMLKAAKGLCSSPGRQEGVVEPSLWVPVFRHVQPCTKALPAGFKGKCQAIICGLIHTKIAWIYCSAGLVGRCYILFTSPLCGNKK